MLLGNKPTLFKQPNQGEATELLFCSHSLFFRLLLRASLMSSCYIWFSGREGKVLLNFRQAPSYHSPFWQWLLEHSWEQLSVQKWCLSACWNPAEQPWARELWCHPVPLLAVLNLLLPSVLSLYLLSLYCWNGSGMMCCILSQVFVFSCEFQELLLVLENTILALGTWLILDAIQKQLPPLQKLSRNELVLLRRTQNSCGIGKLRDED